MGLVDYSRRHGWRGTTNKVELSGTENPDGLEMLLDEYGSVGLLQPAIVISVAEKQAKVFIKGQGMAAIEWAGMAWAKRHTSELALGPDPKSAARPDPRGRERPHCTRP
jgi:penicillin-binding protein 1A